MISPKMFVSMSVAVIATGLIAFIMFSQPLTIEATIMGFAIALIYEILRGKI